MGVTNAIKRTGQVIRCLPTLPRVLAPLDTQAPFSELGRNSYPSFWRYLGAGRSALFPHYQPFRPTPTQPVAKPDQAAIQDDQQWFFINGICTNREVLQMNGKALAELFDREITLLHNPSDGFLLDLVECAMGRTMQIVSDLDKGIADILETALNANGKVVLIAHSQGGIIGTKAIGILRSRLQETDDEALLERLEYYTFASAATEFQVPEVYSEHFFHTDDYVAQIGVAGYREHYTGELFECAGSGHLINCHYLPVLRAGKFKSRHRAVSRLLGYVPNVSVRRKPRQPSRPAKRAKAS